MELRPGYKQTEIGMVPEEWGIEPLIHIGQWFSGGTPSLSNESYWSGDIPWVSPKDMKQLRLSDAIDQISQKAIADGARVLPVGAILMVIRGMILAHSFPVARVERPLAFNQDIKAVVPRTDVDSNFVLYWLIANKQRLRSLITESTHGTKRLPSETLFKSKVCVPRFPEQRAIATTLSDVDALLAKLDQFIAKKRDLKQAAMQQLLTGQTRLPGFSGEWEVKRLGNVAHIKTGAKNNDDKVEDGEYPLFVRSQTIERISTYSYDCEAILVPGEGGIGSIFHYINGKFDCHQRVYKISAFNADTCGKFVFFCMKHLFHKQATRNSVKATVDSLRLPTFLEFEFAAPVREEQQAIVTVLSDMDSELTALESRREKARALKQGMMQELLTGRIRLVSAPRHSPKPSLSAETLADESTQIKNLRRQADFDKSLLLSK